MTYKQLLRRLALAAALCSSMLSTAFASPGAHGPNGEHLDGPPAAAQAGSGAPRLEAHSELFEIVGRLEAQGLQLYISRYESNEAVLGARLDVELGAAKAGAIFLPESGSYLVNDKALLAALTQAGKHALVFTLTAGEDADLLDGSLLVGAPADAAHGLAPTPMLRSGAVLLGAGALVALAAVLIRRSRKQKNLFGAA